MTEDAEPVIIRECEKCGKNRILVSRQADADLVRCGCGETPLDTLDLEALEGRGP